MMVQKLSDSFYADLKLSSDGIPIVGPKALIFDPYTIRSVT